MNRKILMVVYGPSYVLLTTNKMSENLTKKENMQTFKDDSQMKSTLCHWDKKTPPAKAGN